jgi:hypothetical protein
VCLRPPRLAIGLRSRMPDSPPHATYQRVLPIFGTGSYDLLRLLPCTPPQMSRLGSAGWPGGCGAFTRPADACSEIPVAAELNRSRAGQNSASSRCERRGLGCHHPEAIRCYLVICSHGMRCSTASGLLTGKNEGVILRAAYAGPLELL